MKTVSAVALLVFAVAACGQAGNGATPAPTASASTIPAAPTPSAAPSADAATDDPMTSAPPDGNANEDATAIHVRDFTLDAKDVSVEGAVVLAVTNDGPSSHNIVIRDGSDAVVGKTTILGAGESETLRADIPAGSYVLFCSLPGHESLGIKGTLTVTD